MNRRAWLGLFGWLALCTAVAAFGSQFTAGEWYDTLAKPSWTPPSWTFGVVWSFLYGIMAIAAWLVWKEYGFAGARSALTLFLVQLALNGAWSWLFFGLESPGAGLVDILLLCAALVVTIDLFRRRVRVAAMLLLPYLLWVLFATALNFQIWRMN